MKYLSTRSSISKMPSEAILDGLSSDGGLYVPETIPFLDVKECKGKTYQEIAYLVLSKYMDDFSPTVLKEAIDKAYNENTFHHEDITSLRSVDDNTSILELFYGKTAAFKDQALSIYPHLLKAAMDKEGIKHLTILTATSGDTGKAAMESISDVEGLSIAVLYPHEGTSPIQALQMNTQRGNNVFPMAIKGNFDDAQTAVKNFFLKYPNLNITSANSINIARLLPQVVYYYDAYNRLDINKEIDVYVPTGNFGNILAAFIAKEMGLPIRKLVVCTNQNNVLYDFFTKGIYDISQREFVITPSPSMDILISSNLERLLYFVFKDTQKISKWMNDLKDTQKFELTKEELTKLQSLFDTQMTSNKDTEKAIDSFYKEYDILVDPHTATAIPHEDKETFRLIVSTASPYKFPAIYSNIFNLGTTDDFEILNKIEEFSKEPFPIEIKELQDLEVRFNTVVSKEDIESTILDFIRSEESV